MFFFSCWGVERVAGLLGEIDVLDDVVKEAKEPATAPSRVGRVTGVEARA